MGILDGLVSASRDWTRRTTAGMTAGLMERERAERIAQAWVAYYGDQPDLLKSTPKNPESAYDNVRMNYAKLVVDKGASMLFGTSMGFGSDEDPGHEYLEAVWIANRKDTLLHKLGINGGVCGHAWVKLALRNGAPPRIIVLDPASVSCRWAPDDYEDVRAYCIDTVGIDPETGKSVAMRQTITPEGTGWRILDERSIEARAWETVSVEQWPYEFAPVLGCQNLPAPNQYYGEADLDSDVVALQRSMNWILSNCSRIIRYHAHPKTWAKGVGAGDIAIGVDGVILLPDMNSEIGVLEMEGDLNASIELYKRLKEAFHETTRIPEIATGKVDSAGALSGVALQILYAPLIEKTATKRRTYGDMLQELNRRLLVIGGQNANKAVENVWPTVSPIDRQAEAQTALLLDQLGVSKETLIEEIGYDAEEEADKKREEANEAVTVAQQAMNRTGAPADAPADDEEGAE